MLEIAVRVCQFACVCVCGVYRRFYMHAVRAVSTAVLSRLRSASRVELDGGGDEQRQKRKQKKGHEVLVVLALPKRLLEPLPGFAGEASMALKIGVKSGKR